MNTQRPTRVLGVDPGYERMGLAIIERGKTIDRLVVSLCARTPKDLPLPTRIGMLAEETRALIAKYTPDTIAFERIFWNQSTTTALGVAEVRGMLSTLAQEFRLAVFEYSPQQIKVAITGYGASDKRAVSLMLPRLLEMPERKRLDDELDAIAIGLTCLASTRAYQT